MNKQSRTLQSQMPLLAAAMLLLLALAGCGGHAPQVSAPAAIEPLGAGLAGLLPRPADLRGSKAVRDSLGFFAGGDFMPDLPHSHVAIENSASFLPSTTGRQAIWDNALCVYLLPLDDSGPLSLDFHWAAAPPAGAMSYALANYATGRWDWHTLSDPASISIPDSADYISAEDFIGLVLLLPAADSAAGPHQQATLDYFSLKALPQTGWHFTELYSADAQLLPDYDVITVVGGLFSYQGRPAISMYEYQFDFLTQTEAPIKMQLALSSTATGRDLADWSFEPVLLGGLTHAANFAELPGGIGAVWTEQPVVDGPRELHYGYSNDIPEGFTDETITSENVLTSFQLGAINGLPGLAYGHADALGPYRSISYASSDALQSGNWMTAAVSSDDLFSVTIATGLLQLREQDGKPMFGYYNIANTGTGFTVAAGKAVRPAGPADWGLARLVEGRNDVMGALTLNGKPAFVSSSRIVSDPEVCSFWTYELSGSDPGDSASWDITHYDGLELGTHAAVAFAANGSELSFLRQQQFSFNTGGDGILQPVELWSSAAPGNSATDWQNTRFLQDSDAGVQIAFFDGKLVALRNENILQGPDPATHGTAKLVLGVLED